MKITALAGGVGGAKMAQGLAAVLYPQDLTVIVNTGDDFIHFGLHVSPDLDTVCYTLAGLVDPIKGWGRQHDTFTILDGLEKLGGPDWFAIGDKDLCTHLERTRQINMGHTKTEITRQFCKLWGIENSILPMTDDYFATMVETEEYGLISFQEYFVKHRFEPKVKSLVYAGSESAKLTEPAKRALEDSDAIIICPSNPFLSIDPITQLEGVRKILIDKFVLCVSPIIQNQCIKGPLSKMLVELGHESNQKFILEHYKEFLNCFVYDNKDNESIAEDCASGIMTYATNILIPDIDSRRRLATEIVSLLKKL